MAKKKKTKKKGKVGARKPSLTAATADRHALYEAAVQNVESEIDFVDATFKELRGTHAATLREDFCGTGNTSCEWVRRRPSNTAVGLDLDRETLDWGLEHHVANLDPAQRDRVTLLERDVREPGDAVGLEIILAMNFSYWLFMERAEMLRYFRSVRESLADGGIFFLDHYGGNEAMQEQEEKRDCQLADGRKFVYIWDQAKIEPISGRVDNYIHFKFPDGSKMKRAFTYPWRLWSLPEIQDVLRDAGFRNVTVYWEGDEEDGDGGNGEFTAATEGENCPAFVSYITAEK
ncbi:MAG: class I SAM-dependent methyltransferase [Planctomycetota bacterium]